MKMLKQLRAATSRLFDRRRTALRIVLGIAAAVIAFELVFIVLHAASAIIGPIIDVDPAALASGRLRVLCLGESTTATGYQLGFGCVATSQ